VKSDPDLEIAIAITIAIKNRSRKIADRFSLSDRLPFFPAKSIRDFHMETGSRLKTRAGHMPVIRVFSIAGMYMSR
jgi:hypothetical protein